MDCVNFSLSVPGVAYVVDTKEFSYMYKNTLKSGVLQMKTKR